MMYSVIEKSQLPVQENLLSSFFFGAHKWDEGGDDTSATYFIKTILLESVEIATRLPERLRAWS
jgi:hypothetical protein